MAGPQQSRKSVTLRRAALSLAALAVVGTVVYAMLPKPVGVDLAAVERGPLQVTVDEDGQTRIKERYVVSSPLSGRLLRIGLNVGDAVVAGETILARIQPEDPALLDPRETAKAEARVKAAVARLSQAATQLDRAKATLDFAESEVARVRRLVEKNAATSSQIEAQELQFRSATEDYKAAKFGEEIARFELELEQAALLRTQSPGEPSEDDGQADAGNRPSAPTGEFLIRAPISGRVLRLAQESATTTSPGMELVELGDPLDLEVIVDVLSSDAVRIVPGAQALLDQWGGEEPLSAVVRLIEPSGFTKISALGVEEQRVNVVLDFENPPEDRPTLGDGFRVEARIVVWEESDVVKIPTSSLFRNEGEWAVFVADGGRVQLRKVRIGRQNDLEAEVVGELTEGERIVTHPSDKVADGVKIFSR